MERRSIEEEFLEMYSALLLTQGVPIVAPVEDDIVPPRALVSPTGKISDANPRSGRNIEVDIGEGAKPPAPPAPSLLGV